MATQYMDGSAQVLEAHTQRDESDFGLNPPYRVLAIVVAYNSPTALDRCLYALDAQTRPVDGVLVVDNSEPVPADITDLGASIAERVRVVRAGSNTGPAGGFALGLATFMEDGGYSHAWLMDDDCYPEPSALSLIIDAAAGVRSGSVVFPSAVYEATGIAMNYPGWSGVLIDRVAVRLAGLPRTEMFWWAEDTEYLQFRLPRKGVIVVRAPEARVLYDLIRRVGGRPAWKYYYEVRNTLWFRLSVQRGSEMWKLPRTLIGLFVSALRGREARGEKLWMFAKGVGHGLLGRLGSQVRPPQPHPTGAVDDE